MFVQQNVQMMNDGYQKPFENALRIEKWSDSIENINFESEYEKKFYLFASFEMIIHSLV